MKNKNKFPFLILASIVSLFCLCNYKLLTGEEVFTHDSIFGFPVYYNYILGLTRGIIPLWDPFMLTGTPLYPVFPTLGLLDPLCFLSAVFVKLFGVSILSGYVFWGLSRLFVFTIGAYFLFNRITEDRTSSLLAAGILLFSVAPVSFRQGSILFPIFLVPFALYFLIMFLDNTEREPQKYIYFSCFILCSGITSHIYIPALYVLNIACFLLALLFFKFASFKKFLRVFKDKKFLAFSIISLLLLIMMLVPSISLLKDCSSKGELFPIIRVYQSGKVLKKIVASEFDNFLLSEEFHDNKGGYSSYGNMVNLIYPDAWKQFRDRGIFKGRISDTFTYIGILPLLFCIIGFIYSKSRYRYFALIMLIIIFLNMFSFRAINNVPSNWIQDIFNKIFPALGMIEAREMLAGNFLLYLCMLLSLGLKVLFNCELIKSKNAHIITFCKTIAIFYVLASVLFFIIYMLPLHYSISIPIATFFVVLFYKYVISKSLYLSIITVVAINVIAQTSIPAIMAKDTFIVGNLNNINNLWAFIAVILFAFLLHKYSNGLVSRNIFYACIFSIIFVDIYLYNISLNTYTLQDNWIKEEIPSEWNTAAQGNKDNFEYFRGLTTLWKSQSIAYLAYPELILRSKMILHRGINYTAYSTKRYYDLLTNIPLHNQFLLGGAVFPIVRFYPKEEVAWRSKKEIFAFYKTPRKISTFGESLLLEEKLPKGVVAGDKLIFNNFNQFEDALQLQSTNTKKSYSEFTKINADMIKMIRNDVKQYLNTNDYAIEVRNFSSNELELSVNNKKDGYLYYNDGWSKYWKAYDNGREIPVYIANYNSKAVFLKTGSHLLRFVFDPIYYRLGLWSYHIGLVASFFLIVFFLLKRNKNQALAA